MLLSFKNCGTTCVDSSSSSSSSSVVASNIDLLIQILLCLPVKSLLVFKTVSKQWLSLISDPSFVQNHCIQHSCSSITRLLVLKEKFKIVSLDGNVFDPINPPGPGFVPFNDNKKCINIIQSCNGLLLCRHLCYSTFETTYYIYNPSTMHYKILPQSPFKKHHCNNNNNNNRRLSLAFDPIKSPHYHAICIWWKDDCQMEIYSSETDSWRDSISVVNAENDMFDKSGVYWNGSLHWVNTSTGFSLYFDIERELMRTMPSLPDVITRWRCINYFGVYKDHLHLIEIYPHMKGRCDILEMKNDYKGWNIKVRLDLNDFIRVRHPDINWDDIGVYYVLNNGYGFS